jgi:phosphatidate cytidylyltransferase
MPLKPFGRISECPTSKQQYWNMLNAPEDSALSKVDITGKSIETMLKYRLIFGTLMTVFFTALVVFDSRLDGSLTASVFDGKSVQGTILCVLIALLIILAQREFSALASAKNIQTFTFVSTLASILLAGTWYWSQIVKIAPHVYLSLLLVFSLIALLLNQYFRYGTSQILANCGVSFFSIIYLGLLSAFCIAIRIDFGLWPMLMYVFVVKSSDIGAYAIGMLFGRHKFSPKISPGKTWEGMAGAVMLAMIVAVIFAETCGIMSTLMAMTFGFCFAFIGQLGDLAESMMKRDAEKKDSSKNIPGFGGVLDVVDSPLMAAPFAYLFFTFVS